MMLRFVSPVFGVGVCVCNVGMHVVVVVVVAGVDSIMSVVGCVCVDLGVTRNTCLCLLCCCLLGYLCCWCEWLW